MAVDDVAEEEIFISDKDVASKCLKLVTLFKDKSAKYLIEETRTRKGMAVMEAFRVVRSIRNEGYWVVDVTLSNEMKIFDKRSAFTYGVSGAEGRIYWGGRR